MRKPLPWAVAVALAISIATIIIVFGVWWMTFLSTADVSANLVRGFL